MNYQTDEKFESGLGALFAALIFIGGFAIGALLTHGQWERQAIAANAGKYTVTNNVNKVWVWTGEKQ